MNVRVSWEEEGYLDRAWNIKETEKSAEDLARESKELGKKKTKKGND